MNLNSSQHKRDSVSNRRVSIGYTYSKELSSVSVEVGNSNTCDSCESSPVSKELKSLQRATCEAVKACCDEVTSLKLTLQQEIASIESMEKDLEISQKNEERIRNRIRKLASECEKDDAVPDDYIHSTRRFSSSSVGDDTDGSGDKEGDELLDLQLTSRDLAIKAMEEMLAENIKRIHDLLEAQQDGP